MKTKLSIALFVGIATIAFAEAKPQTHCPIMGYKINKALYTDVDGVRIYVCCKSCIAKIQAGPKKIIEKLKADGVKLEKVPKKTG